MPKQLVIQLARFGDIVQTKRLILSLRLAGEVQLCVDKSLQTLAQMVYPELMVHGLPAHGSDAASVLLEGRKTLQALQAQKFDAVYVLNHAGLSRALARLFDPHIVYGYLVDSGQSLRSNWVRLAFRWMADRAPAPLNLVDFWAGLAPTMLDPHLVNPEAKPGGRGLGVVLAGQNARRSLPPEQLAPVVHAAFVRLNGPPVYLLGAKAEQVGARNLLAQLPVSVAGKTTDLTGKTDWHGLADALSGLDLLLAPDTGTVHLAAHLGVPVEGLYCSSAWGFETGPYGLGHRVWQAVLDCSPCTESFPCPRQVSCREAYSQAPFLARMQGRTTGAGARPLQDMVLMQSGFDGLGQIWSQPPGEGSESPVQNYAAPRTAMRALLAEYKGQDVAHSRELADILYQETDWILPQVRP